MLDDRPNAMAATNEVVVPNKSRMREEEIEVPYARESRLIEGRDGRDGRRSSSRASRISKDSRASIGPSVSVAGRQLDTTSPVLTDDKEYYDRMSFSSQVTSRSKAPPTGWDEDREQKIRAEYEFRVAGLERRALVAESERDEARRGEAAEREKRQDWEDEARGLKEVCCGNAS